jgi:hypothetical protein
LGREVGDHHAWVEEEVNPAGDERHLASGRRQSIGDDGLGEHALELALRGDVPLAPVGKELPHQRCPVPASPSELVQDRLQLADVGQPHRQRIVQRTLGAVGTDDRHEVENRPRRRRDWDAIDDSAVVREQEARLRRAALER